MNKKIWLIAGIAVLILVLTLAGFGYRQLTENYQESTVEEEKQELPMALDFTVLNGEEKSVRLSDLKGKPVVVNFWATWCGPCQHEMPTFNKLCDEYKGKVEFMMVSAVDGRNTISDIDSFVKENGYDFPVYYDMTGEASYVYGINSIPTTLFIDENGRFVDGRIGLMNETTLRNYMEKLTGGEK